MKPHILSDFDEVLQSLKGELLGMAGQTLQNLELAIRGLMERDAEFCCTVVADDDDVDIAEKKLDRLGMEVLTRFRPVAADLRLVIASMKVATHLERISDHAVNIAKRARKMAKRPELPQTRTVEPLYEMAAGILRDALSSFIDGDEELALSLFKRDKELDRLYKQLVAGFNARLEDRDGRGEDLVHLILIARSLERVGDLGVNISEDAVFLESAEDIRYEGSRKSAVARKLAGSDPDAAESVAEGLPKAGAEAGPDTAGTLDSES